jgi:hypothetical protein
METETGKVSGLEDLNNQDENSRSDSRVCKRVINANGSGSGVAIQRSAR